MPTRIPVRIGDKDFSSQNQARIYYRDILNTYRVGVRLSDEDRTRVLPLFPPQTTSTSLPKLPNEIVVVRGMYGRQCFELRESVAQRQKVSIMRSIREKALN